MLVTLLAFQITLGVATVLMRKPADIASAHVAIGALVLLTTFVLVVRSMRLYSSALRQPSLSIKTRETSSYTGLPTPKTPPLAA